jgi:hypothetical protein
MFEPKVYKNKLTQQWAEEVLKKKAEESANITMEDMISVVSAFNGKHYWDLENYTIYQIYSDFYRICGFINHDESMKARLAGSNETEITSFAESLDLFHNPYDDIFVAIRN